jgi:hypothetical protein
MVRPIPPIALLSAAFLATAAVAQPAAAPSEDATGVVLRSTLGEFAGRGASIDKPIAQVRPGDTVTITGDCVGGPSTDSLRVVLTLAERPGAATTGYRAVLATDQRIRDGNLQVRVPNLPAAEEQVYQVKVFRLGEQAPQICGAGAIRIGAQAEGKVG